MLNLPKWLQALIILVTVVMAVVVSMALGYGLLMLLQDCI